jgi:hypothetical protein
LLHFYKDGKNSIQLASEYGNSLIVDALINRRVNVDVMVTSSENFGGYTALHFASLNNHLNVVQLLVEGHCNINAVSHFPFRTAFQTALERGNLDVANYLVSKGCIFELIHKGVLLITRIAPSITLEVLISLISQDLPVVVKDNVLVKRLDHLNSWSTAFESERGISPHILKSTLDTILALPTFSVIPRRELLATLIFSKDREGRTVFNITDSSTRQYFKDLLYFCKRYELQEGKMKS